eukprot:m.40149 g.40149  ORF g.40149 m.40149 type:complete len:94 (-) comp14782_c0_seq6:2553-2834(-)
MHDVVALERAGLPSVALVSSAFKRQAPFQARQLGLATAPCVYVQHPISDQTEAQLRAKAVAVFDAVVTALTSNNVVAADSNLDESAQEADCDS